MKIMVATAICAGTLYAIDSYVAHGQYFKALTSVARMLIHAYG